MSQVKIVLTVDYEIFGNGSGNVQNCLIEPTARILTIADKYNVPITLMAEMCEYWAFAKEEQRGDFPKGYSPASWIKEQLISSIQTGHDVQLHIHPQWLNSSFQLHENKWKVDFDQWRVSSLSYEDLNYILKRGKQELESLLRLYKQDYECFVFRAGAWSIQPEKDILRALINTGFKIDTTVASGCYLEENLANFDFRNIKINKPFWFVKENLSEESTSGILEVPIFTKKYSFFVKLLIKLLKTTKIISINPVNCADYIASPPKKSILEKFKPIHRMFDFCEMTDFEMISLIENAKKKFLNCEQIPVVAIGHSKSFNNATNLESFIKKALGKGYKFVTFKDIIKNFNNLKT